MWLRWLGIFPQRERRLVLFLVRTHAKVTGLVPSWGEYERGVRGRKKGGETSMRERNIYQLPLLHIPVRDGTHNPGTCLDWNGTGAPSPAGPCPTHWASLVRVPVNPFGFSKVIILSCSLFLSYSLVYLYLVLVFFLINFCLNTLTRTLSTLMGRSDNTDHLFSIAFEEIASKMSPFRMTYFVL